MTKYRNTCQICGQLVFDASQHICDGIPRTVDTRLTMEQERAEVERCWNNWGGRQVCLRGSAGQVAGLDYWQGWCSDEYMVAGTMADLIHDLWVYTVEHGNKIVALKAAMEASFCEHPEKLNCATCEITMPLRKLGEEKLTELLRGWKGQDNG
jgi:hypothetical protein